MKRAIGYVKVSISEHAIEDISLDNQKAKIQAYCDLNEFELNKIIEDVGKSGKNLNLEGIQNLKNNIKYKASSPLLFISLTDFHGRSLILLPLSSLQKNYYRPF